MPWGKKDDRSLSISWSTLTSPYLRNRPFLYGCRYSRQETILYTQYTPFLKTLFIVISLPPLFTPIGSLTISPRSGIMLGGTNLKMSGPCFKQNDNIVVQFDGNVNINATFGTEIQSSVTVPVLNKTGRVPIKLSVDGGNSFDYNGVYTSGLCRFILCWLKVMNGDWVDWIQRGLASRLTPRVGSGTITFFFFFMGRLRAEVHSRFRKQPFPMPSIDKCTRFTYPV